MIKRQIINNLKEMVISGYKEITKESRFLDSLLNIQKGMLLFIPLPLVARGILL